MTKYILSGRSVLPTLMLYVTNACNSRCNICHLWKIKKPTHLSLDIIRKIIDSPLVRQSNIGLEGGEFFLHPNYREILEILSNRGNYKILSNGLMPDLLIRNTKKFRVPEILISLDGGSETYRRVRGIDGYSKVLESILSLNEYTKISVVYTFSPWNNESDYLEIKELCEQNNINFKINIYNNIPLFKVQETQKEICDIKHHANDLPERDYLRLYNIWLRKKVRLPCMSIRFRTVIWPDGSVPICQAKDVKLGNIYYQSIDEIWNSEKTKSLWNQYRSCNDCWITFHRLYDVMLIKNLEKILPKLIIAKLVGAYDFGS